MMASRRVYNYFDTIKTILNMWTIQYPNFFTYFRSDFSIITLHYCISKFNLFLPYDLLNNCWQNKFNKSKSSFFNPWSKPSHLTIVIPSSHIQLRPNQNNFLVETINMAIIKNPISGNRHSKSTQYVIC